MILFVQEEHQIAYTIILPAHTSLLRMLTNACIYMHPTIILLHYHPAFTLQNLSKQFIQQSEKIIT